MIWNGDVDSVEIGDVEMGEKEGPGKNTEVKMIKMWHVHPEISQNVCNYYVSETYTNIN